VNARSSRYPWSSSFSCRTPPHEVGQLFRHMPSHRSYLIVYRARQNIRTHVSAVRKLDNELSIEPPEEPSD
jgi:hypothetical protein